MDDTNLNTGDTPTMSALKQLSNSLPVANQRVANQQNAARTMQLQQAVAAAPSTTQTAQTAQQTGATMAQQAGAQQVAGVQNQAAQQANVAQLGLANQAQAAQSRVAGLEAGSKEQQMSGEQQLAQISAEAKQEMYDSRRKFAEDQMGKKFTNERQLADYAKMTAQNDQAWQDYQQNSTELYAKKAQMLNILQDKLSQQLTFADQELNQAQDQANRTDISQAQKAANEQILAQKLKTRNDLAAAKYNAARAAQIEDDKRKSRQAEQGAIGSIVGAVAGTALGSFGGPAGAAMGGQAGASLGSAASTLMGG